MEPEAATERALARLAVDGADVLLAVGKAAGPMAEAALATLRRPPRRGLVVVPAGAPRPAVGELEVRAAEHPVPGAGSFAAGEAALRLADDVAPGETVLCLWSGGGSALLEAPVAGVSPEDWRRASEALLRAPLPIGPLNAIRAAASRLKGGALGRRLAAAREVVNVVLSDVPGQPPSVVASGPTMEPAPGTDPVAALEVACRYAALPASVVDAVRRAGEVPHGSAWPPVRSAVAADGATARRAMRREASGRGVSLRDLPGHATGEAREVGRRLARDGAALAGAHAGLVWGGETTVTVTGRGVGGRNEELVLGAIDDLGDALVASFATDGVDGASDAAGAFVDPDVVARCAPGDVAAALADNDADPLLRRLGARFTTGPTGTNVADLILWLGPRAR